MVQITSGFYAMMFLVFGIFSIVGLMVHFIPSYQYAVCNQYAVLVLSVLLVLLIYRSIKKQKRSRNERRVKRGKQPLPTNFDFKEVVVPPISVFFVLYFSLIYGFPSVVHALIASHKGEVHFVAYKPRIDYMNTRPICRGAVTVESPLILPQRVCNVGRYTYENLEDGDKIIIYGRQSLLGLGM